MSISLCVLAKNEEQSIHLPISSVKDYVDEIVVVDDGSTDKTAMIAQGLGARVVENIISPQTYGFSIVYNNAFTHLEGEWILVLDADEFLSDAHLLPTLVRYPDKEAWNLPRRKWENYYENRRTEYEAYPDWQPRLFKNDPERIKFVGECHKKLIGTKLHYAYRGPHIEHLQIELSSPEKSQYRKDLYLHLAKMQGVKVERGNVAPKGESLI
jgi:glycosyltransferase involved in cell wall biosynthesis